MREAEQFHTVYGPESRVELQQAQALRSRMTRAECILWSRLRWNRLRNLHFRRQQVVAGFIVDFYCHEARLVVEVDGGVHERQKGYDRERDRVLKGYGLLILRVRNEQVVTNLRAVVLQIATAESSRLAPLPAQSADISPMRGGEVAINTAKYK